MKGKKEWIWDAEVGDTLRGQIMHKLVGHIMGFGYHPRCNGSFTYSNWRVLSRQISWSHLHFLKKSLGWFVENGKVAWQGAHSQWRVKFKNPSFRISETSVTPGMMSHLTANPPQLHSSLQITVALTHLGCGLMTNPQPGLPCGSLPNSWLTETVNIINIYFFKPLSLR